ncbi:MAG: SUMF1/EgtB/PvdO family nonheme iron enzyme [Candidatus Alcyoniella australis]|nr:SUMF1/EgtB/PvdO family nonheme iron enzyme [Candidatus Alcyoniella australis]
MKPGRYILMLVLAAFSMIAVLGFQGINSSLPNDLEDPVNVSGGKIQITANDNVEATTVEVQGFSIDRYEVTNYQYKQFVDTTDRQAPLSWINGSHTEGAAAMPVTAVTWEDARSFCEWSGKRLPTAEEWQLAAGADKRTYPWGDEFSSNYAYCAVPLGRMPMPVGSYKNDRSPYGVKDMGGNVSEWTSSNSQFEELGWYRDKFKVVLGGSYRKPLEMARNDHRQYLMPHTRDDDLGFRCAR